MASSPPFLRGGFRPFFLLGPAWAVAALALWLLTYLGNLTLPTAFDALTWHRHEMLFGFVGAVVAGFLLTAIPNWTGRLPIAGLPLVGLVGLWGAGRVAVLFSATTGEVVAAILDVGFYLVLAALAAREILGAKNRNLPIVAIVLLIGFANAADHAGAAGLLPNPDIGIGAAISLIVLLISLIGGRVIPSFTRNWMTRHGITDRLPTQATRVDFCVLAVTGIGLLGWTVSPSSPYAAGLLIIAGGAQLLRLSRWGGLRTARDPLVLILHVGYLWIPIGLALLGASILGTAVPRSAGIHTLTAGAMATMILAVMTRATLGHTGRALMASPPTIVIFILVTLGAVLRLAASLGAADYAVGIGLAAIVWAGALVLFLATYGPILFQPRLGEK